MPNGPARYVICAPSFSEENGGAMFLHALADGLNALGETAAISPMPPLRKPPLRTRLRRTFQRRLPFRLSGAPGTRLAHRSDFRADPIVVYPEVVLGNPLRARHVVRWLLYKPGLRNPYRFGPGELFFAASDACDLPDVTGGAARLFLWQRHPAYRDHGRTDRIGTCFLVRKGDAKPRIPETEDAIQIDGLSHDEVARVFNRCETFYSYDEATMYSLYAALCGCLSVVVPGRFASHEDYTAQRPIARYGVSYGMDHLDHARSTSGLVADNLAALQAEGQETLQAFVRRTRDAFPSA
jgi:hypothetical protein